MLNQHSTFLHRNYGNEFSFVMLIIMYVIPSSQTGIIQRTEKRTTFVHEKYA
jgi:hypothetical protein